MASASRKDARRRVARANRVIASKCDFLEEKFDAVILQLSRNKLNRPQHFLQGCCKVVMDVEKRVSCSRRDAPHSDAAHRRFGSNRPTVTSPPLNNSTPPSSVRHALCAVGNDPRGCCHHGDSSSYFRFGNVHKKAQSLAMRHNPYWMWRLTNTIRMTLLLSNAAMAILRFRRRRGPTRWILKASPMPAPRREPYAAPAVP